MSDYGQVYHRLLGRFGKTADEWGSVPAPVRFFHERAAVEYRERQAERMNDNDSTI